MDQGQELRKEDPGAVTGKYLEYQDLITGITAKALQKVDQRLTERGSKDTVTRQIQQMSTDALKQVDVSTDSFKVKNPSVLNSSLNRIKKTVVDNFSEAMAERYKIVADFSNDKDQDLGLGDLADKQAKEAAQNAKVQAAMQELQGVVDRFSNSADQILTQVQGAVRSVPTASQESGVNPALELKYRASEKTSKLRDQVFILIDQLAKKYKDDKTLDDDSKKAIQSAVDDAKSNINYNLREYKAFFLAGDPSQKKYEKEKRDAQDQADGCNSFFCDIGRVVGAVGSAVIGKETGLNVNPQLISSGLFGIDEDHYVPGKYTGVTGGALANVNGRYVATGAYGNQVMPNGASCIGMVSGENKKYAFIEKAYADTPADGTDSTSQQQIKETTGNSNSSSTSAGSAKSSGGGFFSGITGWLGQKDANGNRSNQNAVIGAAANSLFSIFGQNAANNGAYGGVNPYQLPTQGCASQYASPYVTSPLLPGAQQIMGINGQVVPNASANYAALFSAAQQIIAQKNPQLGQILSPLQTRLSDGQYNYNDLAAITAAMQAAGFQMPYSNNPSLQDQRIQQAAALCSSANLTLYSGLNAAVCRLLFTQAQGTVGINPNAPRPGDIRFTANTTALPTTTTVPGTTTPTTTGSSTITAETTNRFMTGMQTHYINITKLRASTLDCSSKRTQAQNILNLASALYAGALPGSGVTFSDTQRGEFLRLWQEIDKTASAISTCS